MTGHVKILKHHRHSHSAGLVDYFITLPYSIKEGKVIKKSNRPAL